MFGGSATNCRAATTTQRGQQENLPVATGQGVDTHDVNPPHCHLQSDDHCTPTGPPARATEAFGAARVRP